MFHWGWMELRGHFRRFGVKLMLLYMCLLLVPVIGIGLFSNFYLQRSLQQIKRSSYQETVAVHANTINNITRHIQDDILYLEHHLQSNEQVDLSHFAVAHTLYHRAVLLDDEFQSVSGFIAEPTRVWINDNQAYFTDIPPNTIQFHTIEPVNEQATLIVIAKIDPGTLLLTLDTNSLLGQLSPSQADEGWAILLPSGVSLVNGNIPTTFPTLPDTNGNFLDGQYIYFYNRTGPLNEWVLLRRVPYNAIHINLSDYHTTFFVLLVGSMISVIGLALFAIARIIEPIYQLQRMFEQLRQTDIPPPLPSPLPTDEFGGLMAAFVHLATELEQKRKIERNLVERLITAQEEERKFIAYDLHDGLIQQLVGARFYLRKCQTCEMTHNTSHPDTKTGYHMLTKAITEGRRIIQGLHPTVLDDLGLKAALEDLITAVATTTNWKTTCKIDQLPPHLDRVTSVTLYRIAQEALNNAFKHACASHVELKLTCHGSHLCLAIKDNGVGFSVQQPASPKDSGGWGIRTMQERAIMLGGKFHIQSQLLEGTTVTVMIPCDQSINVTQENPA